MHPNDRPISITEAAEKLGIPLATLHWWRSQDLDPYGVRAGRYITYRLGDVLHWIGHRAARRRRR